MVSSRTNFVNYCSLYCKYSVNPLYPALERLPFSGFQSSLIADRRGSAIRPAFETLQKANRSCGRARMATSTADHGFTGYLHYMSNWTWAWLMQTMSNFLVWPILATRQT
ncbi:MAG: hypothetical protein JRI35_02545 [Deltaproteobacteria bacterium]|nr:hypothetical protein [Deltaproteobacteria bacterium]